MTEEDDKWTKISFTRREEFAANVIDAAWINGRTCAKNVSTGLNRFTCQPREHYARRDTRRRCKQRITCHHLRNRIILASDAVGVLRRGSIISERWVNYVPQSLATGYQRAKLWSSLSKSSFVVVKVMIFLNIKKNEMEHEHRKFEWIFYHRNITELQDERCVWP